MGRRININADMAEGFGAYDIGADETLLDIVKTANIACGMHAGDPTIMRRVVMAAAERGVSIGAHPGFDDLWGFGRRQIRMAPDQLEYLVAYQIGAMQAMAGYAGIPVTHVKAHGALNNMACVDAGYAMAIARAVKAVDPALIHLVMPKTEMERATQELDLPLAREAFVDRTYEDDGTLTPRSIAGSVLTDPEAAAARVVEMVRSGRITSRHGTEMEIGFDSLCVHGDEPSSVAVARAARDALTADGVEIVPLPAMLEG
ncbi:MAG: 5-oxoprolinase subunit PxpA [Pseudomonadota bacterium]